MGNQTKILKGHKKVGKKFIPPMMQIPRLKEISYTHQIFPEIIWMGLLNDEVGFIQGSRIVGRISEIAYEIKDTEKHFNFAFCSSFNNLSKGQKNLFKQRLSDERILTVLQTSLLPLNKLYKNCPLSFLGYTTTKTKADLIKRLQDCVGRHLNKYETPSLIIQTNTIYTRVVTKSIKFQHPIPDLNALVERPESEEAKRAASFVRATLLNEMCIRQESLTDKWAQSFWNQSYKLGECDFSWEEEVYGRTK